MGRRVQIALAAAVGALLLLAVGAYALDRANSDKIADGVRVGDVEVGGLSTDQARKRLHARLAKPLEKPVTVTFEGTKYTLSPERLELRADVDGMVDAALDASRSGGLPTRVWRYATGGSVDREIAPQLAYSADALDGFLSEVAEQINRPARDATVSPTPASLNAVPAQDGVTVRADELRSRVRSAIESPDRPHGLGPGRPGQAGGDDRRARPAVSDLHHHRSRRLPAAALEEPEAGHAPTRSRSARPARRPRRRLQRSRASRSTRPGTCPTRTGPATWPAR